MIQFSYILLGVLAKLITLDKLFSKANLTLMYSSRRVDVVYIPGHISVSETTWAWNICVWYQTHDPAIKEWS